MSELKLWIRKSDNGRIIANEEIKERTIMSPAQYKTEVFNDIQELAEWLTKRI